MPNIVAPLTYTKSDEAGAPPRDVSVVAVVNPDGSPIAGGGGGGGDPVTNAQLVAVTGEATAAAWDGSASSATMVSILKAIHAQLAVIAANTTPGGGA